MYNNIFDEYAYTDTNWKDKLTNYNGQTITYDAIGNPLSYRGMTMSWQGRQLTQSVKSGQTIKYTYDADGLRASKTVGSTKQTFQYLGGKLMYENRGDGKEFYYSYDGFGNLACIRYYLNGVAEDNLYVVCNSRGDVEALYGGSGTLVARYIYDSWGNTLSVQNANGNAITSSTHIANLNRIRYRGYYWDAETSLYYLQSRYYDPVTCRFINADGQISGIGNDVQGYNMFAYCFNNPVNNADESGNWPNWSKLIGGVLTAVVGMTAVAAVATASACASPVVLAVTAVAGVASMVFGASEIQESFTGNNVVKEKVFRGNERAYNATKFVATTFASAGASSVATAVCFVAGTLISCDKEQKNIEDISSGDMVWSENPETGEKELKRVVQTFENETNELVYIQVKGEEIVATPEHPFYVINNGWVGAIHLQAGDILVLLNGAYAVVENVQHEILEKPIKVYNFEVEDFHTYFVGDCSVLVHNVCQRHHFLSNKNKTYTPQFKEITDKYGLNLNGNWNIDYVENHLGRHTNNYHDFMLTSIKQIDAVAQGSLNHFLTLFGELENYVKYNNEIMYR